MSFTPPRLQNGFRDVVETTVPDRGHGDIIARVVGDHHGGRIGVQPAVAQDLRRVEAVPLGQEVVDEDDVIDPLRQGHAKRVERVRGGDGDRQMRLLEGPFQRAGIELRIVEDEDFYGPGRHTRLVQAGSDRRGQGPRPIGKRRLMRHAEAPSNHHSLQRLPPIP
nr:hypothetical protein [Pseudooceanicola nanhaiensis]